MWKPFLTLCILGFLKLSILTCLAWKGHSPEDALILAPGEVLRFESTESGLRFEAAWNGGVMRTVDGDLTVPDAGNHVLSVLARDLAGNVSPVSWLWIRVDPKPPEVSLALKPPAATSGSDVKYVKPNTVVNVSAADQLAGLAKLFISTNGEEQVLDTEKSTVTLPAEGLVKLKVWAEDAVGNQSRAIAMDLHVDGQPPSGSAEIIGDFIYPDFPDRKWRVAAPKIEAEVDVVDGESGAAGWLWRINGTLVDPASQPEAWPGGDYKVAVIARDRAGNEAVLTSLDFTVDDTPPTLTWDVNAVDGSTASSDDDPCFGKTVSVIPRATDDLSGIFGLYVADADGNWRAFDANRTFVGGGVDLMAVDWVGNQTKGRATWTSDQDAPTVQLVSASETLRESGFEISMEAGGSLTPRVEDQGCGLADVSFTFDGQSWQALPKTLSFEKPGRYALHVRAVDVAGNTTDLRGTVIVTDQSGGERP